MEPSTATQGLGDRSRSRLHPNSFLRIRAHRGTLQSEFALSFFIPTTPFLRAIAFHIHTEAALRTRLGWHKGFGIPIGTSKSPGLNNLTLAEILRAGKMMCYTKVYRISKCAYENNCTSQRFRKPKCKEQYTRLYIPRCIARWWFKSLCTELQHLPP